ncbi:hypothetical protein [Bradyrhizobium sp.]|uniref:hypothetical protein n=1 Tax=Bradyrhizobium sp. TaxID=376 RepID=UPI001EC1A594|nr:hypothetical protein [Bradyrhizobium sp.]MBV8919125.1 hypothetical protein [Bradyrhizobium sp.]MBV9983765.1 hypothetical protein [Bradyrhizobium sp.]
MTMILRERDGLISMLRAQAVVDEFHGVGVSILPIELDAAGCVRGMTIGSGWLRAVVQHRSGLAAPGVASPVAQHICQQQPSAPIHLAGRSGK